MLTRWLLTRLSRILYNSLPIAMNNSFTKSIEIFSAYKYRDIPTLHQHIPISHRVQEASVREFREIVDCNGVCKNRSCSAVIGLGKKKEREKKRETLSAIRTKSKETRWLHARTCACTYTQTYIYPLYLFLSFSDVAVSSWNWSMASTFSRFFHLRDRSKELGEPRGFL